MALLWFDLECDDLDTDEGWGTIEAPEPELVDEVDEPELWLEDDDLGVILVDDSFNDVGFSQ